MTRTKKEADRIVARMDFLRALLSEFGASLSGYQPGVTAYLKDQRFSGGGYMGEALDFNYSEWEWLEPLLVELRDFRRQKYGAKVKRAA